MGKKLAIYVKRFENEDEQRYLYEGEIEHHIAHITNAQEWSNVQIFTDKIKKESLIKPLRAYNRLIKKAQKKDIDCIACYSVALFGRSRDEALKNIEGLLDIGIDFLFFHEGHEITSAKGKSYIKLLQKLTADESVKQSDLTKKRVKKGFQKGNAHNPAVYFLGYTTDKNGNIVINEEGAKIVKRIFNDFLSGKGTTTIAKELSDEKVKTARGNTKWTSNAVYKIIKQEKYSGAVRTQKSVTLEPHTHKRVINRDNEVQYFIRNNHPAIISEELFFKAQRELENRREKRKMNYDGVVSNHSNTSAYSNMFFCDNCGRPVTRRTLTSRRAGEKFLFKAWQCRLAARKEPGPRCNTRYVWEEELDRSIKNLFMELKDNKDKIHFELEEVNTSHSLAKQEKKLNELSRQITRIDNRLKEISNSTVLGKDIAYEESLNELTTIRESLHNEYVTVNSKKYELELSAKQLSILMDELEQFNPKEADVHEIFSKTVRSGRFLDNHCIDLEFKCGISRRVYAKKSRNNGTVLRRSAT